LVGTKRLSQIGWGFRSAPISTTLAAFGTIFEYVSTSRLGLALDADSQLRIARVTLVAFLASPCSAFTLALASISCFLMLVSISLATRLPSAIFDRLLTAS